MSTIMTFDEFRELTPKRALELVMGKKAAAKAIAHEKRVQMRQEAVAHRDEVYEAQRAERVEAERTINNAKSNGKVGVVA